MRPARDQISVRSVNLPGTTPGSVAPTIAVVVITHNRAHVLRECVEGVLMRTSPSTVQIVVWNNASTDETQAYLDSLDDPRILVVHHPENIGMNAYAEGFARTSASHLVEVDDDVTDAPHHWDRELLDGFQRIPDIGFLAADLEDDEHDLASRLRHHDRAHLYRRDVVNGVGIVEGPTGGACAMTSREVYDRVGGFPTIKGKTFFLEDAAYIERIERFGYRKAILDGLRVHHAGGSYNGGQPAGKSDYWSRYLRARARRRALKRFVFRIPFVSSLNRRFGWFEPVGSVTKNARSEHTSGWV